MTRFILTAFFISSLGFSTLATAQNVVENQRLDKIHNRIIDHYPQLTHVGSKEMNALINGEDVLLLDVREAKEFAVSHINGAVRVDPNIKSEDFMTRFGDKVQGKTVILYCSVGRRSSKLGERVREKLMSAGAAKVSNLEGGIFRWHNDEQPLVTSESSTEKVHPYNRWWSRLVARKEDIAYAPE